MKIKSIVAAAVLAATGVTNSFAVTSAPTLNPSASFSSQVSGLFSDTWTFNLGSASTIAASLSNVEITFGSMTFGAISNFSALLNGSPIFGLNSFSSSNPPLTVTTKVLSGSTFLPAGDFTLQVSGNAGTGASYAGSIVAAAVPEPETYAMLLAGLGLMGAVARRRNKSKEV